jgi:hypothetical protein
MCLTLALLSAAPTFAVQRRTGNIGLEGHSLRDKGGAFLGLGATYFSALWRVRLDRARYRSDLEHLSRCGFIYTRTLSMVGWYPAWEGKEIAPVAFKNKNAKAVERWEDYAQQLADMIDIAFDEFGLRTQITIFADAQLIPDKRARTEHLDRILATVHGREHKVILLEVANEAWQNGFAGADGIAELRALGKYLANRTDVLVALSATEGQDNAALQAMYVGSAADIATEHFTRDLRGAERGWLPVCDVFRINAIRRLPPVSNNEPIGPGSSVAQERDPIKLISAAAYTWMSGLPMFVYHSSAGVFGNERFEDMPAITQYRHVLDLLPGDIANWQRAEGDADFTPFITGAGAVRHLSCVKGNDFFTLAIGIEATGLSLAARRAVQFEIINPLTGDVTPARVMRAAERFVLPRGAHAQLIRGKFTQ